MTVILTACSFTYSPQAGDVVICAYRVYFVPAFVVTLS